MTAYSVARLFRSLHNGQPISSSDHNNKSLPTKYQRSIKEWRRLLRLLTPFCDQNPRSYMETTCDLVTHKDFGEFQLKHPESELNKLEGTDLVNLKQVFTVVTNDLLHHIDNKPSANTERVLQPSNLLLIVAELIRSYPQAVETIIGLEHNERSFLQLLLESIVLDAKQSTEMIVAANAVFFSTMNATNSPECDEKMVQIIQNSLHNVVNSVASKEVELSKDESKEFCQKLTTLTKFTNLLKDANTPVSKSTLFLYNFYFRLILGVKHRKTLLFALCTIRIY
jgi:hypothetical protein